HCPTCASVLSVLKVMLIVLVVSGRNPFPLLGLDTPNAWNWSQNNKIYACLMIFFLTNMIENQCLSTGAFEVVFNDVPIWSKLQSGRVPSLPELAQILDNHLAMGGQASPSNTHGPQ
uniref:Selenoprotein T n=1 Tax=Eptatretus burgeri TaxID=7764 RepID=A0A8C4QG27_EPTBU